MYWCRLIRIVTNIIVWLCWCESVLSLNRLLDDGRDWKNKKWMTLFLRAIFRSSKNSRVELSCSHDLTLGPNHNETPLFWGVRDTEMLHIFKILATMDFFDLLIPETLPRRRHAKQGRRSIIFFKIIPWTLAPSNTLFSEDEALVHRWLLKSHYNWNLQLCMLYG